MKCPVANCKFRMTKSGSEPYLTHLIMLHIISDHTLVEKE